MDGEDHPLKHQDFANSGSSFTVDKLNLGSHNLTVLTPHDPLTLDHLLVTVGNPTTVQLADNSTPNNPSPSSPLSSPSTKSPSSPSLVIGLVIGVVVGLTLCGLLVYLITRYISGRRRRTNNWKDPTIPQPYLLDPASRVSPLRPQVDEALEKKKDMR